MATAIFMASIITLMMSISMDITIMRTSTAMHVDMITATGIRTITAIMTTLTSIRAVESAWKRAFSRRMTQ